MTVETDEQEYYRDQYKILPNTLGPIQNKDVSLAWLRLKKLKYGGEDSGGKFWVDAQGNKYRFNNKGDKRGPGDGQSSDADEMDRPGTEFGYQNSNNANPDGSANVTEKGSNAADGSYISPPDLTDGRFYGAYYIPPDGNKLIPPPLLPTNASNKEKGKISDTNNQNRSARPLNSILGSKSAVLDRSQLSSSLNDGTNKSAITAKMALGKNVGDAEGGQADSNRSLAAGRATDKPQDKQTQSVDWDEEDDEDVEKSYLYIVSASGQGVDKAARKYFEMLNERAGNIFRHAKDGAVFKKKNRTISSIHGKDTSRHLGRIIMDGIKNKKKNQNKEIRCRVTDTQAKNLEICFDKFSTGEVDLLDFMALYSDKDNLVEKKNVVIALMSGHFISERFDTENYEDRKAEIAFRYLQRRDELKRGKSCDEVAKTLFDERNEFWQHHLYGITQEIKIIREMIPINLDGDVKRNDCLSDISRLYFIYEALSNTFELTIATTMANGAEMNCLVDGLTLFYLNGRNYNP